MKRLLLIVLLSSIVMPCVLAREKTNAREWLAYPAVLKKPLVKGTGK